MIIVMKEESNILGIDETLKILRSAGCEDEDILVKKNGQAVIGVFGQSCRALEERIKEWSFAEKLRRAGVKEIQEDNSFFKETSGKGFEDVWQALG